MFDVVKKILCRNAFDFCKYLSSKNFYNLAINIAKAIIQQIEITLVLMRLLYSYSI